MSLLIQLKCLWKPKYVIIDSIKMFIEGYEMKEDTRSCQDFKLSKVLVGSQILEIFFINLGVCCCDMNTVISMSLIVT